VLGKGSSGSEPFPTPITAIGANLLLHPSLKGAASLTATERRSTFVLMEVETLGVARSLGWKVHMRCNNGYRLETRSMRKCVYRKQLDLETLVATRAQTFPYRAWSRASCARLVGIDG
jgi:hypothetical protein